MASSAAAPPGGTGKGASSFTDTNSTSPGASLPMGVNLVAPDDYGIIISMATADQEFWKDQYSLALEAQKSQHEAWQNFYSGFTMDDDSECRYANPDLKEFRNEFKKYQKTGATELEQINERIRQYNKTKTLKLHFGTVEVIPLLQPCLAKQEQFAIISTTADWVTKLALLYTQGYYVQLCRDRWMEVPSNYNHGIDKKSFVSEIEDINLAVKKHLNKKQIKEEYGYLAVPRKGDKQELLPQVRLPEEETKEEETESEDEDEDEDEDVPLSSEVMDILSRIGGNDGPLQRYLIASGRLAKPSPESNLDQLKTDVELYTAQIRELTREATSKLEEQNRSRGTNEQMNVKRLEIDLHHLKTFSQSIEHAFTLYNELMKQPDNADLRAQYKQVRDQAKSWVVRERFPANFADAIMPILPGFEELDPNVKAALDQILAHIGGKNGSLHRYIYSLARGKVDEEAKGAVMNVCNQLRQDPSHAPLLELLEGNQHRIMVQGVQELLKLESECRRNVASKTARERFQSRHNELLIRYSDYPLIMEAVVGDIFTSGNFRKPMDEEEEPPIINLDLQHKLESIKGRVGGVEGHLHNFLYSTASGVVDSAAKKEVEQVNEDLTRLCKANDLTPENYTISQSALTQMTDHVRALLKLKKKCEYDPEERSAFAFQQAIKRASEKYSKYPIFRDAVVGNLDKWEPKLKVPDKDLENNLRAIQARMLGRNGPLEKFLHSSASGHVDSVAKDKVEAVNAKIEKLCHQNDVSPDKYIIGETMIAKMIEEIKGLNILLQDLLDHPRDVMKAVTFGSGLEHIKGEYTREGLESLIEIVIGNLESKAMGGTKKVPPKPSSKEKAKSKSQERKRSQNSHEGKQSQKPQERKRSQNSHEGKQSQKPQERKQPQKKPSRRTEYDDDFVSIDNFRPGIILEEYCGQELEKKIVGRLELRMGSQLLLKSKIPGATKPWWEFVAASSLPGELGAYLAQSDHVELKIGSVEEDLKHVTWSKEVMVGGVTPKARRDPQQIYARQVSWYIYLRYPKGSKISTKWFSKPQLVKKFGMVILRAEAKYLQESRQPMPEIPLPWSEVKGILASRGIKHHETKSNRREARKEARRKAYERSYAESSDYEHTDSEASEVEEDEEPSPEDDEFIDDMPLESDDESNDVSESDEPINEESDQESDEQSDEESDEKNDEKNDEENDEESDEGSDEESDEESDESDIETEADRKLREKKERQRKKEEKKQKEKEEAEKIERQRKKEAKKAKEKEEREKKERKEKEKMKKNRNNKEKLGKEEKEKKRGNKESKNKE